LKGLLKIIKLPVWGLQSFQTNGSTPRRIAITPDGSRAYVTIFSNRSVLVLETAINAAIATLPAGNVPFGIAITPILLF